MKKIVSLLAGAMMIAAMASSAFALNLYDANGQNLGTFLGTNDVAFSNFASGWKSYQFDGDGQISGGYLMYASYDCSGTAYISAEYGSYQDVFRIQDKLYAGKKSTTYVPNVSICSEKYVDGVCYQTDCDSAPGLLTPHLINVVDVTEKFPFCLPVAMPLTYK